ncbi:MAG: Stk1 family PASTA domain-containing Ser/Thr kinase, partial [Oscillospiraceae bacterium]|nr:Stk1 family PASTA domain-containing Ser/Thr kinase [Oscillospiraceae bacterium]
MDNTDRYIGLMLDNRYEILEKIGSGGMAVVYKARCHRLNRLVAVKILKEELAGDEEFRRRFEVESQAVAMLSHPNIVAVYDVSRSGNIDYIVMELIDGITLKQYINRKGLLNWKEALHFSTQIAKALSHAHAKGIIHRDIKPHNIMLLKDGSIKVADFGIARLHSAQNTLTQESLGSVHYISPEQAKGGHIDARADIYSLGVVMYEMLTSHLPFVGDSAVSIAIQHISATPLMPREINPDIPDGLEDITMHAMEPRLQRRYMSADDVLADLEEFRKNPATRFLYASDGASDGGEDTSEPTRPVPRGALRAADSKLPARNAARGASGSSRRASAPTRRPELTRDEYREARKRSSRTATYVGVGIPIVVMLILLVWLWNSFGKDIFNPDPGTEVTVPNVIGQDAKTVQTSQGYREDFEFFISDYQASEIVAEGYIISQDPPASATRVKAEGGKVLINLVVSTGKQPPVLMPDLTNNMDYRAAQYELDLYGLGLKITLDPQYDENVTKDYVIRTIPGAGSPIVKDTSVTITYSLGPEIKMVRVPNVVGLNLSAAQLQLESYHLVPIYE